MLKLSSNMLPEGSVGDNVVLPISKPDVKTILGCRNMIGVIADNQDGKYTISTKQGTLDTPFTRNQFDLCPSKIIRLEEMPSSRISYTSAMQNASLNVTYSCKCKNCKSARCPCVIGKRRCHSRCHGGKKCTNRPDPK